MVYEIKARKKGLRGSWVRDVSSLDEAEFEKWRLGSRGYRVSIGNR